MNKNRKPLYIAIFVVIFIVFSLFEGAILTSEILSSPAEKLFWSGMNVMIFMGVPIGVTAILTN